MSFRILILSDTEVILRRFVGIIVSLGAICDNPRGFLCFFRIIDDADPNQLELGLRIMSRCMKVATTGPDPCLKIP